MSRNTARFSVGKCPLNAAWLKLGRNLTRQCWLLSGLVQRKTDDLSLHSVEDDGHVISDSPIKGSLNSGTSHNTEQSAQFHAGPTGTSDVVALPE